MKRKKEKKIKELKKLKTKKKCWKENEILELFIENFVCISKKS